MILQVYNISTSFHVFHVYNIWTFFDCFFPNFNLKFQLSILAIFVLKTKNKKDFFGPWSEKWVFYNKNGVLFDILKLVYKYRKILKDFKNWNHKYLLVKLVTGLRSLTFFFQTLKKFYQLFWKFPHELFIFVFRSKLI